MKYYSEVTRKIYDTKDELKMAEEKEAAAKAEREKAIAEKREKEKKLTSEREARAKEVTDAYNALDDVRKKWADEYKKAQQNAEKLMKDFIKDYGSFHYSIHSDAFRTIDPLFSWFFRF